MSFFDLYVKSIEDRLNTNPIYMIGTLKCKMTKISPVTTSDIQCMKIDIEKKYVDEYPNISEILALSFDDHNATNLTVRLIELGITWDTIQEISCSILGSILDYVTKHNYKADIIENLGGIG